MSEKSEKILEEIEKRLPRIVDGVAPKVIKWILIWMLIRMGIVLTFLLIGFLLLLSLLSMMPKFAPSKEIPVPSPP